jgi:ketosteroid isomerase-like protein
MSNENADLIGRAYRAYASGDLQAMLEFVDPDLEWTYLDPSLEDPQPQVCHGRHELESALARQAGRGLRAQLEEVVGQGDRVMVVVRTPGVDAYIACGRRTTVTTACSRCGAGGSSPCATAAIGSRPCTSPASVASSSGAPGQTDDHHGRLARLEVWQLQQGCPGAGHVLLCLLGEGGPGPSRS